jgi:type IV pilus assembly protein PilM
MATSKSSAGGFLQRVLGPLLPSFAEKNYLTIDIGSSSVKLLEARGKGRALHILNAGIAKLPSDAVQGNIVQDTGGVANAIRTLLDETGVKANAVITALPGPAVIIKRATFPAQEPKELQETIFFEAGNFIPESLENVNLDYQVLDQGPGTQGLEILLVAVRKDVINSYVSAINEAGLIPIIADVDYFALENMFEMNYASGREDNIALINIGARYSLLNILKGGRSAFTGDVPVGGWQFTDMLSNELKISEEQAEEAKIDGVIEGHGRQEIEKVISIASDHLLDEIQHALSFFATGSTEEQVSTVYLSGGTAQLPGLAFSMSERLRIPVEVVDPFRHIQVSQPISELVRQNSSSFAVSAGLATRRPGDR